MAGIFYFHLDIIYLQLPTSFKSFLSEYSDLMILLGKYSNLLDSAKASCSCIELCHI